MLIVLALTLGEANELKVEEMAEWIDRRSEAELAAFAAMRERGSRGASL